MDGRASKHLPSWGAGFHGSRGGRDKDNRTARSQARARSGEVRQLFSNVAQSLVPGGRTVVRDFVMKPERTAPPGGALFAINMPVNTTGGSTYSFNEIREWLEGAGFERVIQLAETETMNSMVEAFRS